MNIYQTSNVCIKFVSTVVPKNTVDNLELSKQNFSQDLTQTIKSIGIKTRHVCNDNTTSLDLAVEAANIIFNNKGYDKSKLGAVVFVTITPNSSMPNNSSLAHSLLGLQKNCSAFDINHACSGYTYGIWISSLICSNTKKDVLLLDADTNNKYVSPRDKSTALLFGDAGSATLIEYKYGAPPIVCSFFTNGQLGQSIELSWGGFKKNITSKSFDYRTFQDGSIKRDVDMKMNGQQVFNYVVSIVPKYIKQFLDQIQMLPEEYKGILCHQPNEFMLKVLAKKTGFTSQQLLLSLGEYGNNSSVSIPLTMCNEKKVENLHGKFLMVGMGAGLSTGIISLDLSSIQYISIFHGDF